LVCVGVAGGAFGVFRCTKAMRGRSPSPLATIGRLSVPYCQVGQDAWDKTLVSQAFCCCMPSLSAYINHASFYFNALLPQSAHSLSPPPSPPQPTPSRPPSTPHRVIMLVVRWRRSGDMMHTHVVPTHYMCPTPAPLSQSEMPHPCFTPAPCKHPLST
jgi:hypothetical protein